MFNLHIIQVMYKIRRGNLNKPWNTDVLMYGKRGENTSNTNMFCAVNSVMTKWPH